MFADLFHALLEWIQHNPNWAYTAVFLIAALESLAIVGLFLPGVAIMFGVGALVAADALALWPTLAWAAAGAIAGDGFSFWLGRHYHQRLRVIWPFRRYPALMNRGVDFFHRHGGKSVILARFIGPVRPILPAVAGMLDMPPRRFFLVNAFSALLWAPAYTLPGVVFGASLGLAAEVAGRLAALLLLLVAVIWFGIWLTRRSLYYLQPRAGFLLNRIQDWGRRRRWAEPLVAAVLDPAHPEGRGLASLVILLAITSLLLSWLFGGWLSGLDLFLFEALRELRTPIADQVLVIITTLGEPTVLYSVLVSGCLWLALRGRYKAAAHWSATTITITLLTYLLKQVIDSASPSPFYDGMSTYVFPSLHASLGVAVYGFLAVLIARELTPVRRWLPYVGASILIIPIAFSRLYLGVHWLSDVLGGLALGLATLALFGIAYRRHPAYPLHWRSLTLVALLALGISSGWSLEHNYQTQLAHYEEALPKVNLRSTDWWENEWRTLPAQRHDFHADARQPLNIQYSGELDPLRFTLTDQGWQVPVAMSIISSLQWLVPDPDLQALPVLPQVHDGQHDQLRLVRFSADGKHVYVLRLWATRAHLTQPDNPLWIGNVTELQLHRRLHLFSYFITVPDNPQGLALLRQDIAGLYQTELRRRLKVGEEVLLVRHQGAGSS